MTGTMNTHANALGQRWPALPVGAVTLAALLFGAFFVLRYVGTLGGLPGALALMCVGMAAIVLLLLNQSGRAQIGLQRATSLRWFPLAIMGGAAWALIAYLLGMALFGPTAEHWFVSVAQSYRAQPVAGLSVLQLHLMLTTAAMLFSPIGEELFFRGYLQRTLEPRYGANGSTAIQSTLFGLVHVLHHGLIVSAAGLALLPGSATVWVLLMIGIALICSWLRRVSDSLYPAMLAHASFNAAMNTLIFAYLWS